MNQQKSFKAGSRLEKVLLSGHFAVTAELGPPKSADLELVRRKIGYLKSYVDAANITDNQTAIVRLSSIATATVLCQNGLEPVIQMTCRDRNRIAIQSDILGAYALGIKNILCLTGDHQSLGNHPGARGVFDLDSIQLVQMLKVMRDEKRFLCGEEIRNSPKAPVVEPRMFIGAAANPFGDPFELRVVRLAKKIAAGADFIQTQCIYDMKRFRQWMQQVQDKGLHQKVHILAGLTPLRSVRMAQYMKQSVAGVTIPDEIIQRMAQAKDPAEEGVKICVEQIEELKEIEGIAGIHLMAVAWEKIVPVIVERAGLMPRPSV
ncbi:MAG: 5,10-methylenetetrahydrofolate reductase [Candidatus Latescibacteria bacterium 4484_181]|nr:MAG: 5,10-methylenetetrahydrofolate reductase [Candidatus Latescibacteria bacterium 4484_181]RKY73263.1 MAG: methylenetetrahydrofolate reductase [Candidatus Latescibacterota bacterium]